MLVTEDEAREWFEGVNPLEDWDEMEPYTKGMLRLEATINDWDEIHHILETGIPATGVLIFFEPETLGLDPDSLEYRHEKDSYESLTCYVLQNEETGRIKQLFDDSDVTVDGVAYDTDDDLLRIEAGANLSD